ncbi:MAG: twin-arginine translocation signal domain-containing protein, partial [Bryobacteraceae bacterium]
MQTISRRDFLGGSAIGVAVAGSLLQGAGNLWANPLGMPIGCQLYPVGKLIAQDFEGTLKQLSAIGYQMVEL